MGAWGTAIFSDDVALDIREEWRDAVLDGLSPEEATARLVDTFADYFGKDADEEKLFWMALAAAQFETGRLVAEVRDRALAIIERGGDVERWVEDGDDVLARQRARVLNRLAAKLRGPQSKPKRIRRQRSLSVPLAVGDVVRVNDEGHETEALVLVVGHLDAAGERDPVVAALDWDGGATPDAEALSRLSILPDPYAPHERLLIWVTTHSQRDVFGPHLGAVVAKDIPLHERIDPRDVRHSMPWRLVAHSVGEARVHAREHARG